MYTDPSFRNTIILRAPDDFVGFLDWGLTARFDWRGLSFVSGTLTAGEEAVIRMGGFPQASATNPVTQYFNMVAPSLPAPLAFGPEVPNDVFDPAPVPEPETWAMLLAGLGLVGVAARRRATGRLPA